MDCHSPSSPEGLVILSLTTIDSWLVTLGHDAKAPVSRLTLVPQMSGKWKLMLYAQLYLNTICRQQRLIIAELEIAILGSL